jgi:hypothetical protein
MKRIFIILLVTGVLAASCASAPPKQSNYSAPPAVVPAAAVVQVAEVSQPKASEVTPVTTSAPELTSVISSSDVAPIQDTQAIIAAEAPHLTLEIVSVTSPVKRGESATLIAQTIAGARCSISVYYKDVRSGLESLNEKTAEASGSVSWTWKTGTDLASGIYRIEVVSRLGDNSESKTIYFTVV